MTEPLRLSKRLARLLPCSRREAELYIKGGWVQVDGRVVDEPHFRVTDQNIVLLPHARAEPVTPATILFHCPADCAPDDAVQLITPGSHVPDDPSDIAMLNSHFKRLSPALPLQTGAGGLTAYTQDRRVLRKLTEDAGGIEQEYNVEVAGELAAEGMKLLRHGLRFDGRTLPPCKVSWQSENRLRFALKDPRPEQIRDACEQVGLQVLAMKRIRIGRVPLAKLPPGQWRYLDVRERF